MVRPSSLFGLGIMWKWTCERLKFNIRFHFAVTGVGSGGSPYMIDFLVGESAVVLENVVVFGTRCGREFLQHGLFCCSYHVSRSSRRLNSAVECWAERGALWSCSTHHDFRELVVGDFCEFGTVVLGNDELCCALELLLLARESV